MKSRGVQILILALSLLGTAATAYFLWEGTKMMGQLPESEPAHELASVHGEHGAPAGEHGAPAGEHGAPAHGEGGGEHAAAEGGHGGGGEHGAPAEGGHGEAPAGEHGGEGGHGAPAKKAAAGGVPLVSLDEVFANISSEDFNHTLAVKLELELFDGSQRSLIDQMQSGIKHTIIQASREQTFERLSSLSGKLYYKEFLVSRVNEYLHRPVIRDIHFSSFFLQ